MASILARIPGIRQLIELSVFLQEGTTVETCHAGAPAMRTVVQLDGDVLTFATAAARKPTVRERHAARVEDRIRAVARRLDGWVEVATWLGGGVVFVGAAGYSLPWEGGVDRWAEVGWTWVVCSLGASAAIGFAGRLGFVRRILFRALVRLVRPV